jgi:putative hydrolase of the HAD superfamily
MMAAPSISTLFLDVGGVLLTNGWDRSARKRAVEKFGLDPAEMEDRHNLVFYRFEEGRLSLDEYLNWAVFYRERPFSREAFKEFMFAQSQAYPETFRLIRSLKDRYRLKVAVVSNEGRELTIQRIQKFRLAEFVDCFVSSCFVHYRKPDADLYRTALDLTQVPPAEVVYIEDRAMFVEVAQSLGIRSIHHVGYESTREALAALGLVLTQ